jgi:biopolymer transport protein ExbD
MTSVMKKNARAMRLERRAKRHKAQATLSLTSLMDIFTILVFFLLVNSDNPAKLPPVDAIQLPASLAEAAPKQNLVVMVTKTDILVQDLKVASVAEVAASADMLVPALADELKYRAAKSPAPLNEQGIPEREVTILSDKDTSYKALRKVMATLSDNDYSKISFGVLRGGKLQ